MVWMKGDWLALDEELAGYYVSRARIAQELRPRRVIEIGTRCGYGLSMFALGAPEARFLCIDGGLDQDSPACLSHWRTVVALMGIDAQLVVVDSHHVRSLPPADFAYVDGDHSYEGALQDLHLVAHAPVILADDCDNDDVRHAVMQFVADTRRRIRWVETGRRRAALIGGAK